MVLLDHGDSYRTRYAHADRLLVKPGETVRRGQKIAVVGVTGDATGVHLHVEVLRKGRRMDPMKFLKR
jgi:murein DD-endopeptidase MepM/ murein hydrolase activator NlpD